MRLGRRKAPVSVLVLGSGPAGLLAVHGAVLAGADPIRVYSQPEPSIIRGAQYLHELPPGIMLPLQFVDEEPVDPMPQLEAAGLVADISYQLIGTAQEYRDKVYGAGTIGAMLVSPETLEPVHKGYDIRRVYAKLWEDYSHLIAPAVVDASGLGSILVRETWDVVVSTIPKAALCKNSHQFTSASINVAEVAFVKGHNIVICDGRPGGEGPSWYRSSRIFGVEMTEWPGHVRPPLPGLAAVRKPIRNTCDCWDFSGRVMFAGRYGRWEKGVLSHHAFRETYDRVAELSR